ncbi:NAD-dependent epimerase/dehydratase family protein [Sphingomonas sp. ac-8]|uniref:NAD-dependent epimerase/dehydratase family protein n=1 Tax=Sphingomonas sp. ac-8 TaxID=3242977 RepID=UPI003A809C5F
MATNNTLITGGAGFIGSRLAIALVAQGHQVTVLDNFSPQIHGENPGRGLLPPEVRVLRGDVRSRDDLAAALEGQTAVVHLAAETGTGQSMYEIARYSEVNVGGTAELLDLLTNTPHSVERIVIASSRAIYGEGKHQCAEHGVVYPLARAEADMAAGDFAAKCPICGVATECVPTDENSRIHPTSVYGITKQVQEQLVLTVGESLGLHAVALRYQNVYGPGQSLKNPYTGILSIFSTQLRNGGGLTVFEDGRESRDFVYVDDVVAATMRALESPAAAGLAINVGSGVRTDVSTVAHTIKELLDAPGAIEVTGNFRLGDIRDNFADMTRAREVLDFTPTVDFATGIARFIGWVQGEELAEDRFARSIDELKARGLYR